MPERLTSFSITGNLNTPIVNVCSNQVLIPPGFASSRSIVVEFLFRIPQVSPFSINDHDLDVDTTLFQRTTTQETSLLACPRASAQNQRDSCNGSVGQRTLIATRNL